MDTETTLSFIVKRVEVSLEIIGVSLAIVSICRDLKSNRFYLIKDCRSKIYSRVKINGRLYGIWDYSVIPMFSLIMFVKLEFNEVHIYFCV